MVDVGCPNASVKLGVNARSSPPAVRPASSHLPTTHGHIRCRAPRRAASCAVGGDERQRHPPGRQARRQAHGAAPRPLLPPRVAERGRDAPLAARDSCRRGRQRRGEGRGGGRGPHVRRVLPRGPGDQVLLRHRAVLRRGADRRRGSRVPRGGPPRHADRRRRARAGPARRRVQRRPASRRQQGAPQALVPHLRRRRLRGVPRDPEDHAAPPGPPVHPPPLGPDRLQARRAAAVRHQRTQEQGGQPRADADPVARGCRRGRCPPLRRVPRRPRVARADAVPGRRRLRGARRRRHRRRWRLRGGAWRTRGSSRSSRSSASPPRATAPCG